MTRAASSEGLPSMDANHDNGELARHQEFFHRVMRATAVSIAVIVVALVLMAIFLL